MIRSISGWFLLANWLLFSGLLAWNHIRVRRQRYQQGIAEDKAAIRDVRSMKGLVLEGVSFLIAFLFWQPPIDSASWRHVVSVIAGELSVGMLAFALMHLGLEWRIKAVVTEDHRLVTTGLYSLVRHPIFAALFLLLISTTALVTRPWAAAIALLVCLYGTEIRIKAEDGLLERRFGDRYRQYRHRVAAYLPYVR